MSIRETLKSLTHECSLLPRRKHFELIYKEVAAIKHELKEKIEGLKDSVPKYPKGSDGEKLALLQMGFNTAIDKSSAVIDSM